jgi:hypothetical protein
MPGAGSTATTSRAVQRASSGDQMPVPAPTSTTGPPGASAKASITRGSYGAVCVMWWRVRA